MSWFDRAVKKGVDNAIKEVSAPGGLLERRTAEIMGDIMRQKARENLPVTGDLTDAAFIWQMAFQLMRTDPEMSPWVARDEALEALKAFLRDEKINFGAKSYSWDQSGAQVLAKELVIEYWERRP